MESKKYKKQYCLKHKDEKIHFIQVRQLENNSENQSLFYCHECIKSIPNFNPSNCEILKQIISSKENEILTSWPPLNKKEILTQFKNLSITEENVYNYLNETQQYFSDFKIEIIKIIDSCEKRIFQQINDLKINESEFIEKYQQISKINDLKSIFNDSQTDIQQKEIKYKELIKQIQSQINDIEEQFSAMINSNKNDVFDLNSAKQTKQSILTSIKNINLLQPCNDYSQPQNKNIINNFYQLESNNNFKINYNMITEGQNRNSNNELEIIHQSNRSTNLTQDQILSFHNKYIFRLQFQDIKNKESCKVGFVLDNNNNQQYKNCFSLEFTKQNEQIQCLDFSKSFKQQTGSGFKLSEEQMIEIRVDLQEKIIEYLDFPHYNNKIALIEQKKELIKPNNSHRLYLLLKKISQKIIVKEAYTVNNFE